MEADLIVFNIVSQAKKLFAQLDNLDLADKVEAINEIKRALHERSPMKNEPVDCVVWMPAEEVYANDYNPNAVAPPEMELLKNSIMEDGFTQPIVSFREDGQQIVVDGFHRARVGKECSQVKNRVFGFVPIVVINDDMSDRGDRIASTIRHNRARGKHRIDAMSNIVIELKRRFWSDEKIGKKLGMDPDEVLRLTQITGLADMFTDRDFSKSWNADTINDSDTLNTDEEQSP